MINDWFGNIQISQSTACRTLWISVIDIGIPFSTYFLVTWQVQCSVAILTSFSQGGKKGMNNGSKCFFKEEYNNMGVKSEFSQNI